MMSRFSRWLAFGPLRALDGIVTTFCLGFWSPKLTLRYLDWLVERAKAKRGK